MLLNLRSLAVAGLFLGSISAAHADNFVTSPADFNGNAVETTSFGLASVDDNGAPLTYSGVVAAGNPLSFGGAEEVTQPGNLFANWSNGYTGDVLVTSSTSETISFGSYVTGLGFYVVPDLVFAAANPTVTLLLSNGQSFIYTISETSILDNSPVFVGFTGIGDVTSVTITVSGSDLFGNPVSSFAFGDIYTVPEPGSVAAFGLGVLALGFARGRRKI